jgi:hypothetical protein
MLKIQFGCLLLCLVVGFTGFLRHEVIFYSFRVNQTFFKIIASIVKRKTILIIFLHFDHAVQDLDRKVTIDFELYFGVGQRVLLRQLVVHRVALRCYLLDRFQKVLCARVRLR